MTIIIFIVGLLVSSAVCYALFAYTIHEMGTNEKTSNAPPELMKQPVKKLSFDELKSDQRTG